MAGPTVRVLGARRLRSTLIAAGGTLDDLKRLHAEIGQVVASGGQRDVPRESGRLASTIRSSGTGTASYVRAGGAGVPYAGVQEFGWPARRIPASPYLTTSLERNEDQIVDLYLADLDRVLATVKGT